MIAACDGDEAWRSCQAHPHPIHLLLTDLVVPGITGRELAGRLHSLRPERKVLCMSGYHDAIDTEDDPGIAYLQEPFTATALATAVCRALDAPGRALVSEFLRCSKTRHQVFVRTSSGLV